LKRVFSIMMLLVYLLMMAVPVLASASETVEIPNDPSIATELSPMSGDVMNIIIIILCISGMGMIFLLLMTITSKK